MSAFAREMVVVTSLDQRKEDGDRHDNVSTVQTGDEAMLYRTAARATYCRRYDIVSGIVLLPASGIVCLPASGIVLLPASGIVLLPASGIVCLPASQ